MRCLFLVKNQYFYHSVVPGLGPEAWIGLYKQLFPGQEHPKPIIDFDKGLGDEEGSTSHPVTSHVVDVNSVAIPVASLPVAQEAGPSSAEKPRPSLAEENCSNPNGDIILHQLKCSWQSWPGMSLGLQGCRSLRLSVLIDTLQENSITLILFLLNSCKTFSTESLRIWVIIWNSECRALFDALLDISKIAYRLADDITCLSIICYIMLKLKYLTDIQELVGPCSPMGMRSGKVSGSLF